ncbi:metallophosphatase domain-containing protein [Aspergillus undulatus]|uniref:metallophosphatase domain-containing protein n=1 Tax=Aspergillus undulatus TaxID=1810928 RepID=UPI003CCC9C36
MLRRKTRFVCVSDTHAYTPSEAGFKLPAGDVLIHAGDLTNWGSKAELQKTMAWIAAADYEVKIVICGNHDITLDVPFYTARGSDFHRSNLENPQKCLETITNASGSVSLSNPNSNPNSNSIIFLNHQSALIRLRNPNGPNTIFKIFGSPYSQHNGNWAFLYTPDEAEDLWGGIPLDADVVVTHGPPRSMVCGGRGCKVLRRRLGDVRPCLAICGHVHEGRGYERVNWGRQAGIGVGTGKAEGEGEGEGGGEGEAEETVKGILPPQGSKKQSLVDLTGKRAPRLDNNGLHHHHHAGELFPSPNPTSDSQARNPDVLIFPPQSRNTKYESDLGQNQSQDQDPDQAKRLSQTSSTKLGSELQFQTTAQTAAAAADADTQAQRRETCIVNAAIMATNWPHPGGRKFHPGPIVVDLELPVWKDREA